MMSASASPLSDLPDRFLCYYVNTTAYLQRVYLANLPPPEFERVIFPHQRLLFEASSSSLLEVCTWLTSGKMTLVKIPCLQLKVSEGNLTHAMTDLAASQADLPID